MKAADAVFPVRASPAAPRAAETVYPLSPALRDTGTPAPHILRKHILYDSSERESAPHCPFHGFSAPAPCRPFRRDQYRER